MRPAVAEPALSLGGECDPWFEPVKQVFEDHFRAGLEHGAALCLQVDGRAVVDLWGGTASRREGRLWQRDTIVNVYSATKGLSALCVHRLIERGGLSLEAPVARYWPEFAAAGKGAITVAQLLSHQAGLAAIDARLPHAALYDHALMARHLAAQPPNWEPGDGHGYHPQTFGFLVGELVRRVAGETLGQFLRRDIAGPLEADFHIGIAPEHDARIAHVTRPLGEQPPAGQPDLLRVFRDEPGSLTARAFANPAPSHGAVNTRAFRAAELPGSNGHGNARALARVYGALAAGELLSSAGIVRCQDELASGIDRVLRIPTRFGPGFLLGDAEGGGRMGPTSGCFGHPGMGGSLGFADPGAGLGFGYTTNRAGASILVDDRARRLIDACYACL